ncbi:hypothetical protein ACFBZI_09420 [Moraxella sp. ZJ142]|uniref:hypothetical protein n=1 Tax=Moraxella marmotae TaxID=3344520 RepID=UPI0035D456B4
MSITIQDFMNHLAQTELHNMFFWDKEHEKLNDKYADRLAHYVLMGLRELYTRFDLCTLELDYPLYNARSYVIDLSNDKEVKKQTKDTQILAVNHMQLVYQASDDEKDVQAYFVPRHTKAEYDDRYLQATLNDNNRMPVLNPRGFYHLASPTKVMLYNPHKPADLVITVRVIPYSLDTVELGDELPLPVAYHNALGLFIASRVLRSMDNQLDGDLNESTRYYQAYQQELMMLEQQGIELDTQPQDYLYQQFHQRGFI